MLLAGFARACYESEIELADRRSFWLVSGIDASKALSYALWPGRALFRSANQDMRQVLSRDMLQLKPTKSSMLWLLLLVAAQRHELKDCRTASIRLGVLSMRAMH